MMGYMIPSVRRGARSHAKRVSLLLRGLGLISAVAQVNYSVRVEMEKPKYLLGEPIFAGL